LRLERLEDRIALSGFGAGNGAYIVESWNGQYGAVKIQPTDQKILVAGGMLSTGGVAIARYDSAGNPDAGWGSGGLATPALGPQGNPGGAGLAIQADGRVDVAGTFLLGSAGQAAVGVGRLNLDGSLDTSFGTGGRIV
jgi:hypothetical protein